EHTLPRPSPPPKVLPTTYTGRSSYWSNTRSAPPPTSGPVSAQRLPKKRELITLKRPPRTQIAPPPSYSSSPSELPSAKVRFWTVSRGVAWLSQWAVVQTCCWSQVFMYRMRVRPPPLRVTLPPPS